MNLSITHASFYALDVKFSATSRGGSGTESCIELLHDWSSELPGDSRIWGIDRSLSTVFFPAPESEMLPNCSPRRRIKADDDPWP